MQGKDISISTVEVSIKVLKVGKNKMTIAVYDQIPRSDNFTINSTILGWVNKHFDGCNYEARYPYGDDKHYHFIWLENGELRKGYIFDYLSLIERLKIDLKDFKLQISIWEEKWNKNGLNYNPCYVQYNFDETDYKDREIRIKNTEQQIEQYSKKNSRLQPILKIVEQAGQIFIAI